MNSDDQKIKSLTNIIALLTIVVAILAIAVVWLGCKSYQKLEYQKAYSVDEHIQDKVCEAGYISNYTDCVEGFKYLKERTSAEPLEVL